MAVGLKTIEIIEKENLLKNAQVMGEYFIKRLKEMQEKYPDKILDVRGLGLMIGVDFKDMRCRDHVVNEAFKQRLLLLGCGFKTIRIAPPLIIKEDIADHGLYVFEAILKDLK
jgi:4-aminobutyrate aminotransferase-like enzyme